MKKLLYIFCMLCLSSAVTAQMPYVRFDHNHYYVKNIPRGYMLRYFAKIKEGRTYYIVLRPIGHFHDDARSRIFYGTADSLVEVPLKNTENKFNAVHIETSLFVLHFPMSAGDPWLSTQVMVITNDDADDEEPMDAENSLMLLPNN